MVDDDDGDGFPSSEPRTDSRSALPREFRAWRRLRIVKRDESFSHDFVTPEATGNGRKSYQITDAGKAELQQNQQMVDAIFARLAQVNRRPEGNMAEGISDAMHRLRHILRSSMMRSDVTPEQVEHINAALLTAVEAIEKTLEPKATETNEPEKS